MEIVIEILLELFGEIIIQVLFELGFGSIIEAFKSRKESNTIMSVIGVILLAIIFGFLFSWLLPSRMFPNIPITGLSIILAPLVVGFTMHEIGEWKKKNGKVATIIATFWGGALFALVISLIRFLSTKYEYFIN